MKAQTEDTPMALGSTAGSDSFSLAPAPAVGPHAALVAVAVRWLRKSQGCGVVFAEHSAGWEHPDAMGWKSGFSRVVECKVSRSDFFADRKKPSRRSAAVRPGVQCWYLTPPGLLRVEELPEGWGLLEFDGRRVRNVLTVKPDVDDRDRAALRVELYRLYCEVRRYQLHGLTYPKIERRKAVRPRAVATNPATSNGGVR